MSPSERVYAGLLHVYPATFRARYRDEMLVLFGDQLRDARAGRGATGVAGTWARSIVDLISSAIGEHLRRDRAMGHSLSTFEPTPSMRLLGLFGVVAAVLLLVAFASFAPFENLAVNTIRLFVFALGGPAIAIAFYGRQATVAPMLTVAVTGAVVVAGAWFAVWNVLSLGVDSRFSGTFGWTGVFATVALWVTPSLYGLAMLRIGAAWRGMSRPLAAATRVGAILLLGSFLADLGDDHWGLVNSSTDAALWTNLALLGVTLNGTGWLLLGSVLLLGGRAGHRTTA